METKQTDWHYLRNEGMPDFRIFGFHTGTVMEVMLADKTVHRASYQGYGEFSKGSFTEFYKNVIAWRKFDS